jgi:hypothetical protein
MRPLLLFMSNSLERGRQSIFLLLSLTPFSLSPPVTLHISLVVVVPPPPSPDFPPLSVLY